MPKGAQRFSWTYNHETGIVVCDDKVTGKDATFDVNAYPDEVRAKLEVYALQKRLQELESGTDADEKLAAYKARDELLIAGKWDKPRQTGGPTVGDHITLIMRRMELSAAAAQQAWRAKDKDWQEAFKVKYKDDIAKIAAERDTEIDLDDMI